MNTIVVPTDFSQAAEHAAFYAAELALKLSAAIELVHVSILPLTASEIPLPPGSATNNPDESGHALKELKAKLESRSHGKLNISFRTSTDSFLFELDRLNHRKDVFAVVMGASGISATAAFFIGSFSLAATKYLECPLIVVPKGYHFRSIEKIGFACDMDNVLDHIPIRGIRTVFDNFNAKMEVLYVSDPGETMLPEVLRESRFIQICLAHYQPEIKILTNEDVRDGLNDFAVRTGIDLLLILPKERNFIDRIFHKSISKGMALHPGVPIMIVHK
jgi:nucleotide-binding universal stress UspA family protein